MFRSLIAASVFGSLCATFALADAREDTIASQSLGNIVGLVDEIITVQFEPKKVLVLEETMVGEVRQYRATALPLELSSVRKDATNELIVGAPMPINRGSRKDNSIHYAFFMASNDAQFAATEVKKISVEQLKANSQPLDELLKRTDELSEQLKLKRVELINAEEKLARLRERASQIADIDEIVDLKMKLSGLKMAEEQKTAERDRLKALLEDGQTLGDPPDIDKLRAKLALDLEQTAKATALADRLEQRRKDSAMQNFLKKVNLVKDMENVDPKDLAREVLRLRKKRRELERRLGMDSQSDEF